MTHLSNKKLLVILLCTGLCGLFAAFFITAQNNALQMASDTTNEVFSALNITSADTNGNTTELIDAASDSLEEVSESLASSEDSILKSLNTVAYTTTDSPQAKPIRLNDSID